MEANQQTEKTTIRRKKFCNAPCCQVKTIHMAKFDDAGRWGMECGNCGKHTPAKGGAK
jgi:hypothetical protein